MSLTLFQSKNSIELLWNRIILITLFTNLTQFKDYTFKSYINNYEKTGRD